MMPLHSQHQGETEAAELPKRKLTYTDFENIAEQIEGKVRAATSQELDLTSLSHMGVVYALPFEQFVRNSLVERGHLVQTADGLICSSDTEEVGRVFHIRYNIAHLLIKQSLFRSEVVVKFDEVTRSLLVDGMLGRFWAGRNDGNALRTFLELDESFSVDIHFLRSLLGWVKAAENAIRNALGRTEDSFCNPIGSFRDLLAFGFQISDQQYNELPKINEGRKVFVDLVDDVSRS